jgi:Ca2+-binding RTX toxin-like protein
MHDSSGIDSFEGGSGIDTVAYITGSPVIVDLQAGLGSAGDAAGDTYSDIENVSGGTGNDSLSGNAQNNLLDGGIGGNDWLEGREGNDTLIGGGGADVLLGGDGADRLVLDAGSLAFPATDVQGGAGSDSVMLMGTASVSLADLLGAMTEVESIDFTAPGVAATLSGFTGADALSLLGTAPGLGNVLTLDIDLGGDDSFSASGFVVPPADPLLPGTYVFYQEAELTNEIARVSVI